ncbi:erythromycin biosynthesis sensory transduction protein eryC1 [Candidatus Micrarchaeota archaeon]|nr:MAG: erythromycin biosynthesis sensory transduction protein eryC1 [Candidatus Micrarchaeota archaeon]
MEIPFVNLNRMHEKMRAEFDQAYSRVLNSSSFILGKEVAAFEKSFSKFVGSSRAIGVASGTDALILSLRALGIGKGDEVLVPSHTFVASPFAISAVGAKPVFVEVDDFYTLSHTSMQKALSKRTKAVMPVHLYGQCADMPAINEFCENHDLKMIEDACQAHGASLGGKNAGTYGIAAAFSFYPGKNLGALGDGGAICTDDSELAEKLISMRNYGSNKKYHHDVFGFNSRLDGLQAAFLNAKLSRLEEMNQSRIDVASSYAQGLSEQESNHLLQLPKVRENAHHVYHLFVIQVNAEIRDQVLKELDKAGIKAQIHYPIPCHEQKAYSEQLPHRKMPLQKTEKLARRILSLPIWPYMTHDEIEYVVQKTSEILVKHGREIGR